VVWNLRTHHRASVLCWDGQRGLSSADIAAAMLSRWGASENTFRPPDLAPWRYGGPRAAQPA